MSTTLPPCFWPWVWSTVTWENCTVIGNVTSESLVKNTFLQVQFAYCWKASGYAKLCWLNQNFVDCLYLVASQSEAIIVTEGKQLMGVVDSTRGHNWLYSRDRGSSGFENFLSFFLFFFSSVFLNHRRSGRIESTCQVLTCVGESQISNISNASAKSVQ